MKQIFKNILLTFDHSEETGLDYKKITAFWFVLVSTILLISYSFESIDLYWIGVKFKFRKELIEFKWILGITFAFILTLIYFTNSKDLTKFILKFKGNDKGLDNKDSSGA